jgi:hypothetical protein
MPYDDEALGALTTVYVALVARLKSKGILSQDEIRVMFDSILLELEESELARISDVRRMHGIISHLQAVLDPVEPRKEAS